MKLTASALAIVLMSSTFAFAQSSGSSSGAGGSSGASPGAAGGAAGTSPGAPGTAPNSQLQPAPSDGSTVGHAPGVNSSNPQDLTNRSDPQDLTAPGGNNPQDLTTGRGNSTGVPNIMAPERR